jgi:2-succinyl-5-enolpyruvyl-6-hydroxy-3-cyclohexene-1-carboxylate synthase
MPDERAAGFYAMGLAQGSGAPAGVICTSGSALANLAPAMTEAFYSKIPLVAITADRPLAWTDQGNGQTIRQEGIFQNFVKGQFSLIAEPHTSNEIWMNRRKLSELFNAATTAGRGPIHINIPLEEPLYGTRDYREEIPRFFRMTPHHNQHHQEEAKLLAGLIKRNKKVMFLIGQQTGSEKLTELLIRFSGLNNCVILTETTGNIDVPKAIDCIDRCVMPISDSDLLSELMPDVLISLGGYIVSKKIKALLREFNPKEHWHIDPFDFGLDTFQSLTTGVQEDPASFLNGVIEHLESTEKSGYTKLWAAVKESSEQEHSRYISALPYSDFEAFRQILASLPDHTNLHLSNSSPVRYAQLFGKNSKIQYYANRGTSGIDGCTSTAAGIAAARPQENHILITGDLAFVYDSNGLWNRNFPKNFKIIVINNQGGGIFRIIDGPQTPGELEPYFEAHHPANIKSLAAAFGIAHVFANDSTSLKAALPEFHSLKGSAILEVVTPQKENSKILKAYFKQINKRYSKDLKEVTYS